MALNDLIRMQRGSGAERTQWTPIDEAYPWVISHRLFPMALLAQDGRRKRWVETIAQELDLREDIVDKIVGLEAGNAR